MDLPAAVNRVLFSDKKERDEINMCWTLEDVAQANLDKLASRQQRGVIDGNGDHR